MEGMKGGDMEELEGGNMEGMEAGKEVSNVTVFKFKTIKKNLKIVKLNIFKN